MATYFKLVQKHLNEQGIRTFLAQDKSGKDYLRFPDAKPETLAEIWAFKTFTDEAARRAKFELFEGENNLISKSDSTTCEKAIDAGSAI